MSDTHSKSTKANVPSSVPRIAVVGCGGTISSFSESPFDVLDYPEFGRKLSVEQLLSRFPEALVVANVLPVDFSNLGSTAFGPAQWLDLRKLVHKIAASHEDIVGIVILHGTATLEETAYFLDLTNRLDVPIVLVGAQRPASAISSDAGMNLVAALRVAGSESARSKGVLVVLNDEIHAARDVTKTSTYRLQTFQSREFGLLGTVDGDGVHFTRCPIHKRGIETEFSREDEIALPRVDIVYSYSGADGALVRAAVAAGAAGIVSAGLAPGIPTPGERAALIEAVSAGIVVVQCSRASSGRVALRRYLQDVGIVAGEDLSPPKARILLSLMLGRKADRGAIQQAFRTY